MWSYIYLLILLQTALLNGSPQLQQSVVKPLPICPCEYKYNPVCGSDRLTYINDCVLTCTSDQNSQLNEPPIRKSQDSECSSCICQSVNLPVCTLEGLTFPNECELGCDTIRRIRAKLPFNNLAYRTACLGPSTGCTTIAAPVCGTNNILYRNKCVLDTASSFAVQKGLPPIGVKNNGACLDGCLCPVDRRPVCGSDGCIHDNVCHVTCQNNKNTCSRNPLIYIVDKTECKGCNCEPVNNPVCGTDGRTYNNPCELGCEAKREPNSHLTIDKHGPCSGCYCTKEWRPVCGTDRKTYGNECELRCANSKRLDGYYVGVLSYGECQPEDCNCNHCPDEYQPMCGSDGRTYWNLCWLNCNTDCLARNKNTSLTLTLKSWGSCDMQY